MTKIEVGKTYRFKYYVIEYRSIKYVGFFHQGDTIFLCRDSLSLITPPKSIDDGKIRHVVGKVKSIHTDPSHLNAYKIVLEEYKLIS
jgi:hypothetical protein